MVRQYKIHTALGAQNDEVIDVTNGKVRFYQPSNLGFTRTNSIAFTDNIGVLGNSSTSQPDIQFKLETFGDSLEENYTLLRNFVQKLEKLSYITLEYQTDIFQVYADLAISEVTKTEGYGNHGQFSETITFNVITKWYTYEQLTLKTFENSDVVQGVSKIYGGYLDDETPIENYNRLKSSGSLNLPTLNLLTNSRLQSGNITPFATVNNAVLTINSNVKGLNVSCGGGAIGYQQGVGQGVIPVSAGNQYTISVKVINTGTVAIDKFILQFGFYNSSGTGLVYPNKIFSIPADGKAYSLSYTVTVPANATAMRYYCLDTATLANVAHTFTIYDMKAEQGSTATPYMPSADELTTDDLANFFGYNYIPNISYKYYGEFNIERLSRWQIDYEVFSFFAELTPRQSKQTAESDNEFGVKFFDPDGNNYTGYLYNLTDTPTQITINTDVNNEYHIAVLNGNTINIFPDLNFQAFRTRLFVAGTMELVNLTTAVIHIKRKANFV